MSTPQLSERTRKLIMAQIKGKIASELAAVRVDRNDPTVNVTPPKEFFIFDGAHTYQCPAIFLVVDSGELPEQTTGANHVNALMKLYCSAVVEATGEEALTILCERYQAALFQILHQLTINDTTDNVKLYSRVVRFRFSEIYTRSRKNENMGNFRKEIALELEVKHFENPTS